MTNLREPYASTALASLEWSEERERAIDRIAAAGKAPKLGLQLWCSKYLLEAKSYQNARIGLIEAFLSRYGMESSMIAEKCVEEALGEFLGPACITCNGARELIYEDLKVVCQTCDGSGLRRYSDTERARRMQLSVQRVRSLAYKLRWLLDDMESMDRLVNIRLNEELER